ncbi:hypothetical protein B296_00005672, partial [Ensete ventricosum]
SSLRSEAKRRGRRQASRLGRSQLPLLPIRYKNDGEEFLRHPDPSCRRGCSLYLHPGASTSAPSLAFLVRLFATQSEYADRLAAAVSKANKLKDEESAQLKTILQDLKSMPLQELSILSIGIYA